ncbi:MAG TPA: glycosyltransferase family 39 protein, partial [Gaiellales bacterium]|nr:glycosyltransferase family 39 protein [Gaiellales bacterium]
AWTELAAFTPGGLIVDENYYHRVANFVAHGMGYISPAAFDAGHSLPSAEKPPLYPLLLALETKLGGSSFHSHRLLGALLGAATIVLLGLVARRIGGPRLGLIAAALIAVNPVLWRWDSQVLSEPLYAALLALLLLTACWERERPGVRQSALLGVVVGLAGLTRPEALIFAPLLALLMLVWDRRAAVVPVAAMCAACAAVMAPWVIRNWSAFDRPLISNQSGETIAGANCPTTYHGIGIGFWDVRCLTPIGSVTQDEAERVGAQRAKGLRYARDHLGRVPLVLTARVGRTWGFFRPIATDLQVTVAWVLLVLAIPGFVLLRRRGASLAILLLPAAVVTIASVLTFGWLRYRFGADIALTVLAAATVEAALVFLAGKVARPAPTPNTLSGR